MHWIISKLDFEMVTWTCIAAWGGVCAWWSVAKGEFCQGLQNCTYFPRFLSVKTNAVASSCTPATNWRVVLHPIRVYYCELDIQGCNLDCATVCAPFSALDWSVLKESKHFQIPSGIRAFHIITTSIFIYKGVYIETLCVRGRIISHQDKSFDFSAICREINTVFGK